MSPAPRSPGRRPPRNRRPRTPARQQPQPERIEPSSPTRVGVASVRRPWGTGGAVAVTQFSDDEDRFAPGTAVYLEGGRRATVTDCHRSGSAVVLELDVVRNARDAGALRGTIIEMESEDLPNPPDGSFYHYEIIGARVRTTGGEELGEVRDIIVTGANDVYVVGRRGSKDEVLVPAIADVVLDVDVNNRVVTVDLPEGLR